MYVNGRFLTQRITGVQRVARELMLSASQHKLWPDSTLLAPTQQKAIDLFEDFPVKVIGKRQGHLWEQWELPRAAKGQLLVNLCNTAPALNRHQLVMLHDAAVAAFPHNFTFAFRGWYQAMIRSYGRFSRQIVTVSSFSADEIIKHFSIPASRIEIIPESGEHILRQAPDYSLHAQYGLEADSYILAVSSHAPNKNFDGVAKAIALLPPSLPYKFVIVGGRNTKIFSGARTATVHNAIEVGFASDAQLRALYERAACFVYPSLYEGFGLPPLEAMSCGCPVLVSNVASLPETCGDAAAYCNPNDATDIARALARILESRSAREELRAAGLARAREWTWHRAATQLDAIIARIT